MLLEVFYAYSNSNGIFSQSCSTDAICEVCFAFKFPRAELYFDKKLVEKKVFFLVTLAGNISYPFVILNSWKGLVGIYELVRDKVVIFQSFNYFLLARIFGEVLR